MTDKDSQEDIFAIPEGPKVPVLALREDESRKALERISGDRPRNVGVFWCLSCGMAGHPKHSRGLTLRFPPDELEANGGDVYNYAGPCPFCHAMTLVPYDKMSGQKSIDELERDAVEANARVNARVLVDVVKDEFFAMGQQAPVPDVGHGNSGERADLPDADDVDDSSLEANKVE